MSTNTNIETGSLSGRPVTATFTGSSSSTHSTRPHQLPSQYNHNGTDGRDSRALDIQDNTTRSRKPQGRLRLSKKAGPSTMPVPAALLKTTAESSRLDAAEDDDDWTFEGGRRDGDDVRGNGRAGVRESMEVVRDVREPSGYRNAHGGASTTTLQDQTMERDRDKDRESKGRRLVKKTSQLFGRKDKDKDRDRNRISPNPGSSSSSVYLPTASRQSSKSSGDSQDRRPLASRVPSGSSTLTTNGAGGGFLGMRRPSQDSQAALGAYTANGSTIGVRQKARTGSTSTYGSSQDAPSPLLSAGPLPPQRRSSQLAPSAPALSRQSTQPAAMSIQTYPQQGPSVPTRMSAWFSGLISSSAGSDTSSNVQTSEPATSPVRATANNRGSSAAATFLNAARQKAVEGVRNLLDSEAQPDRCLDPIWLMGVSHPGYVPPLPTPPFGQVVHDVSDRGRPGSSGSGSAEGPLSTPPPPEREKGLRAGFQRRQLDRGQGSPAKGLGQLFGGSTASLVGSPSKDSIGRLDESPNRAKKGKEKEVLKWPEECEYWHCTSLGFDVYNSLCRFPVDRVVLVPLAVCAYTSTTTGRPDSVHRAILCRFWSSCGSCATADCFS
jgi:cysteine protease ATG4